MRLHDAAMLERTPPPGIERFLGLNNATDPLRAGLGFLSQADNVHVTDTGALEVRRGYTRVRAGAFTGMFSTFDSRRGYLVDGGQLQTMGGVVLLGGLSGADMHWSEVNDQVFYSNGTDSGIINPDNTVLPWTWAEPQPPQLATVTGRLDPGTYSACITYTLPDGRETGASDFTTIEVAQGEAVQITPAQVPGLRCNVYLTPANSATFYYVASPTGPMVWNFSPEDMGHELMTGSLSPLPSGCSVIQAWGGRMYAAQYFPDLNQSAVWFSQPMAFHLFDTAADFFLVPGQVRMLAPHEQGLVIGTDSRIMAYAPTGLAQLAEYGVIPGQHWAKDDNRIIFWSERGVCAALPFTNLTERQVSVAPGLQAGGTIVRSGGQKRYLVALHQGGAAFNSF